MVKSKWHLPGLLLPVSSFQWRATADPYICRRPSSKQSCLLLLKVYLKQTLTDRSGLVCCGVTWVLVYKRFCLFPPRVESLFLPVLCLSCKQIPLAFKVRFPGNTQSLCKIPWLGNWMWSLEFSQQLKNLFGIIVLQFLCHPPGRCEI